MSPNNANETATASHTRMDSAGFRQSAAQTSGKYFTQPHVRFSCQPLGLIRSYRTVPNLQGSRYLLYGPRAREVTLPPCSAVLSVTALLSIGSFCLQSSGAAFEQVVEHPGLFFRESGKHLSFDGVGRDQPGIHRGSSRFGQFGHDHPAMEWMWASRNKSGALQIDQDRLHG